MAITSTERKENTRIIDKVQASRLGGFAPFVFPALGLDPSFPLFSPRTINLNLCDKSTFPVSTATDLREEFAGAALDDAIRADYAVLHPACGAQVSLRGCADGHLYGISAICGREWCTRCGGHRGRAHNRRIGQYLAMIQEWGSGAYAVLTIPPELRPAFADLKLLSKAGAALRRWLRGRGIRRGVSRWHLFGEGVGVEESPISAAGFAPHINILCEAGYLPPALLSSLRREWRLILERLAGREMESRGHADRTDALVIEWQYVRTGCKEGVGKLIHWLTYMMGPRFLDSKWDHFLALSMVGWRNSVRWGKRTGVVAWELDVLDGEATEGDDKMGGKGGVTKPGRCVLGGECPECGGKLRGLGMIPRDKLVVMEDYGGGVYKLAMLKSGWNKPKMENVKRGS